MINPPENSPKTLILPDMPADEVKLPELVQDDHKRISGILNVQVKETVLTEKEKQHPLVRLREVCPEPVFSTGGFLKRILDALPRHTIIPDYIRHISDDVLLEVYLNNAQTVAFMEGRKGKHGLGLKAMVLLELYLYRMGQIEEPTFIYILQARKSRSLDWVRSLEL